MSDFHIQTAIIFQSFKEKKKFLGNNAFSLYCTIGYYTVQDEKTVLNIYEYIQENKFLLLQSYSCKVLFVKVLLQVN